MRISIAWRLLNIIPTLCFISPKLNLDIISMQSHCRPIPCRCTSWSCPSPSLTPTQHSWPPTWALSHPVGLFDINHPVDILPGMTNVHLPWFNHPSSRWCRGTRSIFFKRGSEISWLWCTRSHVVGPVSLQQNSSAATLKALQPDNLSNTNFYNFDCHPCSSNCKSGPSTLVKRLVSSSITDGLQQDSAR